MVMLTYKRSGFSDAVTSVKDALAGARDIMAEWINENGYARNTIRAIFSREAIIYSRLVKGKEAEGDKFRDYFNAEESLSSYLFTSFVSYASWRS